MDTLENSKWSLTTDLDDKVKTICFYHSHKCTMFRSTNTYNGMWVIFGNTVTISLTQGYSNYVGKLTGSEIIGTASNKVGLKWTFKLKRITEVNEVKTSSKISTALHAPGWFKPEITFAVSDVKSTKSSQLNGHYQILALSHYYQKTKYPEVPEDIGRIRQFVYHFKDAVGNSSELAAVLLGSALINKFSVAKLKSKNVICCIIPASTQVKSKNRFQAFCAKISSLLECTNGYGVIEIVTDSEAAHLGGRVRGDISNLKIYSEFVRGRTVYLFDDIITSGKSFVALADKLKEDGATEVIGVFLGKTYDSFRLGEPSWI